MDNQTIGVLQWVGADGLIRLFTLFVVSTLKHDVTGETVN